MRCECCNQLLTTQESTRKFKTSNTYVDMCNKCLETISDDVDVTEGNFLDEEKDSSYGED
jgi:hypothetical protein